MTPRAQRGGVKCELMNLASNSVHLAERDEYL
jgi:hypothetical protein